MKTSKLIAFSIALATLSTSMLAKNKQKSDREQFVANKRAIGRKRDIADLEALGEE